MSIELIALTGGRKETASSASGHIEHCGKNGVVGPGAEHARRERKGKEMEGRLINTMRMRGHNPLLIVKIAIEIEVPEKLRNNTTTKLCVVGFITCNFWKSVCKGNPCPALAARIFQKWNLL